MAAASFKPETFPPQAGEGRGGQRSPPHPAAAPPLLPGARLVRGIGAAGAPLAGAFPAPVPGRLLAAGLPGGALARAGARPCQNKAVSLSDSRRVHEMGAEGGLALPCIFSFLVHLK